jgi:hypothetical protein
MVLSVAASPVAPPASNRLAELRAAGLIRPASEPGGVQVDQVVPVGSPLRPLFPSGGLRRGSTVAVSSGATSLLLALLAEASAGGAWCALVGMPQVGVVAAAEAGLALERLVLVPDPGAEWSTVCAALLDGVDIVIPGMSGPIPTTLASRLTARARQRGGVLMPIGSWPGADLTLDVVSRAWYGLGQGEGRLRRCRIEVLASGRGAATRPRRVHLWLGPGGGVDEASGGTARLRLAG